jgi:hypothetical protein
VVSFTLKNESAPDTTIGYLFFDLGKPDDSGTPTVGVTYDSTSDGSGTIASGIVETNTTDDYTDYNYDLTGLGITLSPGESVTFYFTNLAAGRQAHVDNVGIAAIPEPGSMLALGCFLGSGLLIRLITP